MSLHSIPVEILELVLGQCAAPAIHNLRLTCRRISHVADEHFLQSTTLFFVRDDLDTIEDIVQQNHRVASSLAHVTFQTDHLRPFHEYGSWKRLRDLSKVTIDPSPRQHYEANLRLCEALVGASTPRRQPDPAFDHYTRQWQDQESLYQEKRAYTCFHKLFTSCPKLNSISINTGPDHGRPQSWKTVEAFRKGIVAPKGPDFHGYINSDLTKAVTCAAKDAGKSLNSIAIEPISSMYFYTGGAFNITSVLHNLQSLRLNICEEDQRRQEAQARGEEIRADRGICNFLSQAANLRSLNITCAGSRTNQALNFMIAESTIWPRLHTLTLTNFEVSSQSLASLLLRHRRTLTTLNLCDLVFASRDADLQTCFAPVAGRLNALEIVSLRGRLVAEPANGRVQILQLREGNNAVIMESYMVEGGMLPLHELAIHE